MRCRATVGLPSKAADTMVSFQWVLPPGAAPAWPICLSLSSTSSSRAGASAARRLRISPATVTACLPSRFFLLRLPLLYMAGEKQRLAEHEQQHQPGGAKELYFHANIVLAILYCIVPNHVSAKTF